MERCRFPGGVVWVPPGTLPLISRVGRAVGLLTEPFSGSAAAIAAEETIVLGALTRCPPDRQMLLVLDDVDNKSNAGCTCLIATTCCEAAVCAPDAHAIHKLLGASSGLRILSTTTQEQGSYLHCRLSGSDTDDSYGLVRPSLLQDSRRIAVINVVEMTGLAMSSTLWLLLRDFYGPAFAPGNDEFLWLTCMEMAAFSESGAERSFPLAADSFAEYLSRFDDDELILRFSDAVYNSAECIACFRRDIARGKIRVESSSGARLPCSIDTSPEFRVPKRISEIGKSAEVGRFFSSLFSSSAMIKSLNGNFAALVTFVRRARETRFYHLRVSLSRECYDSVRSGAVKSTLRCGTLPPDSLVASWIMRIPREPSVDGVVSLTAQRRDVEAALVKAASSIAAGTVAASAASGHFSIRKSSSHPGSFVLGSIAPDSRVSHAEIVPVGRGLQLKTTRGVKFFCSLEHLVRGTEDLLLAVAPLTGAVLPRAALLEQLHADERYRGSDRCKCYASR
jgi:hypothetical protein